MAFEPLTYLLDFKISDFQKLEDAEFTLRLLEDISDLCGFQVVSQNYKKFAPQGLTAMLLLAESHISIHTWPEKELFCIDIFTCKGKINLTAIINLLQNNLPELILLHAEELCRLVPSQKESSYRQEAGKITRF